MHGKSEQWAFLKVATKTAEAPILLLLQKYDTGDRDVELCFLI